MYIFIYDMEAPLKRNMKPCSKTPLSFPETIQQDVFFMHVLVLEF